LQRIWKPCKLPHIIDFPQATSCPPDRYRKGQKLAGVIYLHCISDFRMSSASVHNFKMFRKLCGDSTLKNVVIVTTMWGLGDHAQCEARERELITDPAFFKPALDMNAKTFRDHSTCQSAHEILRHVIRNEPEPLRIQCELVDEGKGMKGTEAGEALTHELADLMRKTRQEIVDLGKEMREAVKNRDEEARRELEQERAKHDADMKRRQEVSDSLNRQYAEQLTILEAVLEASSQPSGFSLFRGWVRGVLTTLL
jgi:hypothetical protein